MKIISFSVHHLAELLNTMVTWSSKSNQPALGTINAVLCVYRLFTSRPSFRTWCYLSCFSVAWRCRGHHRESYTTSHPGSTNLEKPRLIACQNLCSVFHLHVSIKHSVKYCVKRNFFLFSFLPFLNWVKSKFKTGLIMIPDKGFNNKISSVANSKNGKSD